MALINLGEKSVQGDHITCVKPYVPENSAINAREAFKLEARTITGIGGALIPHDNAADIVAYLETHGVMLRKLSSNEALRQDWIVTIKPFGHKPETPAEDRIFKSVVTFRDPVTKESRTEWFRAEPAEIENSDRPGLAAFLAAKPKGHAKA